MGGGHDVQVIGAGFGRKTREEPATVADLEIANDRMGGKLLRNALTADMPCSIISGVPASANPRPHRRRFGRRGGRPQWSAGRGRFGLRRTSSIMNSICVSRWSRECPTRPETSLLILAEPSRQVSPRTEGANPWRPVIDLRPGSYRTATRRVAAGSDTEHQRHLACASGSRIALGCRSSTGAPP
jgi:hypothetical protein